MIYNKGELTSSNGEDDMQVSLKLAHEFNTILLSHLVTLSLLIVFTSYIYHRAKKTPLLYSYLAVVGMIALWLLAKILKTVSPVIELRWIFILLQYFAIDSLGPFLLIFAYIYQKKRMPSKKALILGSILPLASFVAILTNPLHMTFYSYFDIYRDSFGTTFYFAQSVHYLYLIAGIAMLTKGFTSQPIFNGKKSLGNVFAVFVLLPVMANFYYLFFKMDLFEWIFPFPVFDFSPIAASISLIFFAIPTLKYRFFDLSPLSQMKLFDSVTQGIVFIAQNHSILESNASFDTLFNLSASPVTVESFLNEVSCFSEKDREALYTFFTTDKMPLLELTDELNRTLVFDQVNRKHHKIIIVKDLSLLVDQKMRLSEQNHALEIVNKKLDQMARDSKALYVARNKSKLAQNIHDILGHSITVVLASAEVAATQPPEIAKEKALQIEELMISSLNDLRNTFKKDSTTWNDSTLSKILHHLKNDSIDVEISIIGNVYETTGEQTEAVYRMCQEAITNAIKHGQASKLFIILKYTDQGLNVYTIDNGKGCSNITHNHGLQGIANRFHLLSGSVQFSSDGESGFSIHANIPKQVSA